MLARKPLPPSALLTWLPLTLAALAGAAFLVALQRDLDTTTLATLGITAGVFAKVGMGGFMLNLIRDRLKRNKS